MRLVIITFSFLVYTPQRWLRTANHQFVYFIFLNSVPYPPVNSCSHHFLQLLFLLSVVTSTRQPKVRPDPGSCVGFISTVKQHSFRDHTQPCWWANYNLAGWLSSNSVWKLHQFLLSITPLTKYLKGCRRFLLQPLQLGLKSCSDN